MIKAKAIAGRIEHAAKKATLQIGTMQRARRWLLHLEWQGNSATIAATIATTLALGLAVSGRKPWSRGWKNMFTQGDHLSVEAVKCWHQLSS